jgi:hypothetical protein
LPEQIRFEVPAGVVTFHWSGPGRIKVHTQFATKGEAIEVFARLREEMDLILDTLSLNLDLVAPSAPPGNGTAGLLESVLADPRLVARQRPTSGSGELNYSKLPPRAALNAAQLLAEEQVKAYAQAQGRASTRAAHPENVDEGAPIEIPQAKRVEMKAELKPPTHEEALKEAAESVERQKAAIAGRPWPPPASHEEQMLPPPPPAASEEVIAEDLSKSS